MLLDPCFVQIQLVLGTESSIAVGWQKRDEKTSAAGEVKVYCSIVPMTFCIYLSHGCDKHCQLDLFCILGILK